MDEKIQLAQRTKDTSHKETRKFLVDDVEGTMHRAYGAFPNLVYVINPEGRIAYRLDWSTATTVEAALRNRDKINEVGHRWIWGTPPWILVPICLRGGWNAVWDLGIATPTIIWWHLKADIADLFRRRAAKKQ